MNMSIKRKFVYAIPAVLILVILGKLFFDRYEERRLISKLQEQGILRDLPNNEIDWIAVEREVQAKIKYSTDNNQSAITDYKGNLDRDGQNQQLQQILNEVRDINGQIAVQGISRK
ncbi:hypothetical protein [Polynucleobacter necessarius]|uniref:hypothetical protein n=1 Tax=Polynucleobacter necessarius TaxID=576610 RepID=UPI0013B055CB|nr:hypothetical protein [Polynucleobacter necessarius]